MTAPAGRISKVAVFDLDDTLYLERQYVLSGFRAVGHWVARNLSRDGFYEAAWKLFLDGVRGDTFDRALSRLGLDPDTATIAAMVNEYRTHAPLITLEPDVLAWIDRAPSDVGLAIITDGWCDAQQRKVEALGLRALGFDPVIITDLWGREWWKPHERAFLAVQEHFGIAHRDHFYVADNPAKDFVTPNALGWTTIQISRPGRLHGAAAPSPAHAARRHIEGFADLPAALDAPTVRDFKGAPACD